MIGDRREAVVAVSTTPRPCFAMSGERPAHTRPAPAAPSPARRLVLVSGALVAVLVAACGGSAAPSPSPAPPASPSPSPIVTPAPSEPTGAVIVTFKAANGKTWKQRLTDPADIEIARKLLAGEEAPTIPNGKIVRTGPDVNEGWSWHLDPNDFEWADMTVEVCDGLPDYVEDGTLTSDRYCSWEAKVVAVDPLS
jgi:hypothetical protein